MPVLRDLHARQDVSVIDMSNPPTPPIISYGVFIGIGWAGAAIALIVLVARLFARYRNHRRFFLDDLFISIATVLIVVTAGLWQWRAVDMYYTLNLNAGLELFEADAFLRMHNWLYVSFAVELFFYTTLILFKLSMMFFFRRLGDSVHKFGYLWWPVLLFALSTYFIAIGNIEYKCLVGETKVILTYCNSPKGTKYLKDTMIANAALDVFSDFLIMLIPIILLWKVQIQWRKKIIFLGIFSLSLIIMGVAIARAADIEAKQKSNGLIDITYLWFWSDLQTCLCIVVACSSSFPQLFMASSRSQDKPAWKPTQSYYDRLAYRFRSGGSNKKQSDISMYDVSVSTQGTVNGGYVAMDEGSQEALNDGLPPRVLAPPETHPAAPATSYRAEDPTRAHREGV